MKIRNVIEQERGWRRFDLNVGGFTIRGCRWHVPTRRIVFPLRRNKNLNKYRVVFAYGRQVMRLRGLLESGQTEAPRDRRPCTLRIHFAGRSRDERLEWIIFDFTVRGFKILGCRWQPESGCIQLPVTFNYTGMGYLRYNPQYFKKPVVCAYGAHINRLRKAVEAEWNQGSTEAAADRAEEAVPA